ncbi:5-formyltetrahydrofolate cyclo-ligase [Streptococcus orisasini]|uniref:5-formyltetrahydrofolate cyclo-ligase n=1 Tax=Streptococcus orisasini TaxID=1080071 RepID=UPI000708E67E|nr:5-formyltetrahydrofolate cyclo-ligase [Streptococcus orisasini]
MTKKELRAQMIEQLKNQSRTVKTQRDQQLVSNFIELETYKKARTLATYLAFPFEFDTSLLIEQAQKDGKRIVVPKTYGKGKMVFVSYNAADLEMNAFGLKEPRSNQTVAKSDIDLIHVPGLAFNNMGYRLGFGGGYYDRYLADFAGSTVSTAYPFQMLDFEPDYFDIPVKEVLQYGEL